MKSYFWPLLLKDKLYNSFGTHLLLMWPTDFDLQDTVTPQHDSSGYCWQCYTPPNFQFDAQLEKRAMVASAGPFHPTAPVCACVYGTSSTGSTHQQWWSQHLSKHNYLKQKPLCRTCGSICNSSWLKVLTHSRALCGNSGHTDPFPAT